MEILLANISSFLFSPSGDWLLLLKIALIILSVLFVAFIILTLTRTEWAKFILVYDVFEFLTFRPYGVKKIEKLWNKIKVRLDTGLESEYKLSVVEADNLLDDIFKKMGYGGASLGERLDRLTAATLPNIAQIRESHLARNNIIHDPDYKLSLDETKKVLDVYETAFREIQAF